MILTLAVVGLAVIGLEDGLFEGELVTGDPVGCEMSIKIKEFVSTYM